MKFFRNPKTGEVVIAQFPNPPLWLYLVATAARLVFDPSGTAADVLSIVAGVGLVTWAVLEVGRGDSPFRRVLGAAVLVAFVVGRVT